MILKRYCEFIKESTNDFTKHILDTLFISGLEIDNEYDERFIPKDTVVYKCDHSINLSNYGERFF